ALSYLSFAFVLSRIVVSEQPPERQPASSSSFGLKEAVQLMIANKVILSTTIMFMCANIGMGILTVYLPLLSNLIAPNSSKVYGLLLGIMALGEVISASLAGSLVAKTGLGTRIAFAQLLSGAALALLAGAGFRSILIGLFLLGFSSAPLTIWAQTLR